MSRPPLIAYAEAIAALVAARASVLLGPAKRHFGEQAPPGPPANMEEIALVQRTIAAAARRLPIRTLCYEQALAARTMLKRRGRSSRLHFGGGRRAGELTAHVWLSSGERIVTGEEEARNYVDLA